MHCDLVNFSLRFELDQLRTLDFTVISKCSLAEKNDE